MKLDKKNVGGARLDANGEIWVNVQMFFMTVCYNRYANVNLMNYGNPRFIHNINISYWISQ